MPSPRLPWAALGVAVATLAATIVLLRGHDSYVLGSIWWGCRGPFALVAVGLLLWSLRRTSRVVGLVSGATLGLLIVDTFGGLFSSARPPAEALEQPLRVVSHNLLFRGNHLDESLAGLRDAGAELIALQEVTPEDAARLTDALRETHPYSATAPHPGANGFALFSRHPLAEVSLVRLEGRAPIAQCATSEVGGGRLPICNVHLSAPSKALNDFKALPDFDGLEQNARRRSTEWSLVERDFARRGGDRALALGDFNSTEAEPLYRSIRHEWVDAFRDLHLDYGATWPHVKHRPPFARIDYVFTKGRIRASEAQVIRRSGSDHLPIAAELRL